MFSVVRSRSQLHLAQKELHKLKEHVKTAQTTKAQVLEELENAKKAVEYLTLKLNSVRQFRELAIKQMESTKDTAKYVEGSNSAGHCTNNSTWKQDLESLREQYSNLSIELDSAKQELHEVHRESNAALESKVTALKMVEEAEKAVKANQERVEELSNELSSTQESIEHVKLATLCTQQDQAKIFTEKDIQRQSCRASFEEYAKKLLILRNEFDPELAKKFEEELSKTTNQIGFLKDQMESERASDLEVVKSIKSELDEANGSLFKVAEQESSLRNSVESLNDELEKVRNEHSELNEKEAETESLVGNLHVKLHKSKLELEACLVEESKARGACDEMVMTLEQLSMESEKTRREAEGMKNRVEELKKEFEATRAVMEEAESNLRTTLEEADTAKAAEASTLDQIKSLSERTTAARSSTSESGNNITISKEELESLSRKVNESDTLAGMKVAAALAQVEAVKASEYEALTKEATQKEIEDMKAETEAALKRAEMAEAAKRAVEEELRKWLEREQKKVASRILVDAVKSYDAPSPQNYRVQKPTHTPEKIIEVRELEKEKIMSKKSLEPIVSGIFNRKKNQVEGGSLSYLPRANPV